MEKHDLRKTKISSSIYHILILIFTSTLISCGQTSKNQTNITVGDSELGLVFTKQKRFVLASGEHRIEKESKVILFNTIDSLSMEKFDILDSNVKSLYCQIRIKYSLTPKQIEEIADLLDWPHSIESYKKLLIAQEIKSEIRSITGNYPDIDLKNENYKDKAQIEKYVSDRLGKYIDLISIDLKIYDKQ